MPEAVLTFITQKSFGDVQKIHDSLINTYYDDFEDVGNFEKNVKYLFDFTGDKLVIGKFCMIASDVAFIMNGANHASAGISTYPFAIFGGDWSDAMKGKTYPVKGNTVIG